MSEQKKHALSPTRQENFPDWYQEVVKEAELAEHSGVRGCMVVKPWGYGIWENIQKILNEKIKASGHENAYFPLFIPLSLMVKEAKHVEGFAKECAVVTHSRLEKKGDALVPADPLEEPLIIRPTSEMIIGQSYAKWVHSYRDLPLKINQWANIVRWEMRPRLFLRTVEFLWQEGHTVHATKEEALEETLFILNLYDEFFKNYLAMPSILGRKSASERFPGAVDTFSLEAMMQDKKALQAGTSHFLGQNFSKSCGIRFSSKEGNEEYAWTTSWGVTTRLIGGIIMSHSDDDGLVLPPRIAPKHLVILPILVKDQEKVIAFCDKLKEELSKLSYHGYPVEVIVDHSDKRGGEKKWHWIKKGIPLQLEIGARDIEKNLFPLKRRDSSTQETLWISREKLLQSVISILDDMQEHLFTKAKNFLEKNLLTVGDKKELWDIFGSDEKGGFVLCHMKEDEKVEKMLKEELGVTIRNIPFAYQEKGKCLFTKEECKERVILAKSY